MLQNFMKGLKEKGLHAPHGDHEVVIRRLKGKRTSRAFNRDACASYAVCHYLNIRFYKKSHFLVALLYIRHCCAMAPCVLCVGVIHCEQHVLVRLQSYFWKQMTVVLNLHIFPFLYPLEVRELNPMKVNSYKV